MKGWKTEFLLISVIFLCCVAGYLLFEMFFLFLSTGLFTYLLWHLYQLNRFCTIFITNSRVSGSVPAGLWGSLYQKFNERQDRWLHYRHNRRRIFSRFQQAFKLFPYTIIILDKSWKIKWYNSASEKIFNRNNNIINNYINRLIDHPVLNEYLQSANFTSPLEIESPLDKVSVLSLQFIPLSGSGSLLEKEKENVSEKESETLLIIRDITSAYHLDQTRKDFIANVTHELKTPLTVINGFLEPMCEDMDDFSQQMPQDWDRYIELIYQQNKRMNDIVNELLLLSQLEMDNNASSEQLINMPELLQNTIQDAKLLSGDSAHQISIRAQENLYLKGEVNSVKAIVNNLIVNAIKYTSQRSRITLSWYAQSNQAFLIVQDTGEGIAPRHLSRLTERFYRIESGRSREKGGTGLGLSIVNHALQRHQGELKISSEIGRGSSFTCIFPKERIEFINDCCCKDAKAQRS